MSEERERDAATARAVARAAAAWDASARKAWGDDERLWPFSNPHADNRRETP